MRTTKEQLQNEIKILQREIDDLALVCYAKQNKISKLMRRIKKLSKDTINN